MAEQMTEAEFMAKYGRPMPKKKTSVADKAMKRGERKYFDSGDHFMCQAGKGTGLPLGQVPPPMPTPETIPHPSEHKEHKPSNLMQSATTTTTAS